MAINGQILQQAGQGDAYILPAFNSDRITERLDHLEAVKAAKIASAAKAKQDRDKRLDELMKWTPEQAWYPHTEQVNGKVKEVYNYMTDIRKQDGEPSPDQMNTLNQKKWEAETVAKKSQDIKALYPQLRQDINGMDKYTNKEYLQSRLNDEIFGDDGKKDVNAIDFNNLGNITSDPKAFNAQAWTEDFAKSLPENIDSMIGTMQAAGGDLITDKEVKSKFFDLDSNGNVRYQNGKPVINVSDETVDLATQEPRFNAYVQDQLSRPENKYKTPKDIVTKMLTPYAKREEKLNVSKGFSNDEKDSDVNVATAYDQTRSMNDWDPKTGKTAEFQYNAPITKSLYDKKDKKVMFNSPVYIDMKTGKAVPSKESIGNKNITPVELQLLPYNPKKNQIVLTKDGTTRNPDYLYKWYLTGTYNIGEGVKQQQRHVLIPTDNIKPQLKSAYGIDVDEIEDPMGLNIKKTSDDPLGILK